jgi:hypothetical protein
MKHSNGTIESRTHNLLVCSTVPRLTAALCTAFKYSRIQIIWAGTQRRQIIFCLVFSQNITLSFTLFFYTAGIYFDK